MITRRKPYEDMQGFNAFRIMWAVHNGMFFVKRSEYLFFFKIPFIIMNDCHCLCAKVEAWSELGYLLPFYLRWPQSSL